MATDTAAKGNFRKYLPDLENGRYKELHKHNARSWTDIFFTNPIAKKLTLAWLDLRKDPFKGLTTDGKHIKPFGANSKANGDW